MRAEVALKDALLEIISCMLSPLSELRGLAEERKKALEVTEEYALHLMEILVTSKEELEERQMAGILLRQYVDHHWDKLGRNFFPPLAPDNVKIKIRTTLPMGLADPNSKIRTNIVMILVTIAEIDFPHNWIDMLECLSGSLYSTENVNMVLGFLEFLQQFNCVTLDKRKGDYAAKMYPVLYSIAQNSEHYSTRVRGDAIKLFSAIGEVHSSSGDATLHAELYPVFVNFMQMCKNLLVLPHPTYSDYFIKSKIIHAYKVLLSTNIPDLLMPTVINILPVVWQVFSECGTMYDVMLMFESSPIRDPSENIEDTPLLYILISNILDLLRAIIEVKKAPQVIMTVLDDIIYMTILFMGMTKDIENLWQNDADLYYSDDTNEGYSGSHTVSVVRHKAKYLLISMGDALIDDPQFKSALMRAVNKHTTMSTTKNESYRWRIMEAVMLAMGTLSHTLLKLYLNNKQEHEDLSIQINGWVNELRERSVRHPVFLRARIVWVGARYAPMLVLDVLRTSLMSVHDDLEDPSDILRYLAIRSIKEHMSLINFTNHRGTYLEARENLALLLIPALENLHGAIYSTGISALEMLIKLDPTFIGKIHEELTMMITTQFILHATHPDVIDHCMPLIKLLSSNRVSQRTMIEKLLPLLTNVLNETVRFPRECVSQLPVSGLCTAIHIMDLMVKYAPEPLNDILIRHGFTAVYKCIIAVDDREITEGGADCLRSFICKGASLIVEFTDAEGKSGTQYILDVLNYVLDPCKMEFACRQVARLFITAMHTLGPQLSRHIDFMLRGVISSMQRATTVLVEESLLSIFAYVFYYQLQPVLDYLLVIPGPDGQSALNFILDKWLSKNYSYGGKYCRNLSILAMIELMEYTISQEDERVARIKVRDEPIHRVPQGLNLPPPSVSLEAYCTEAPVLLKILKYLLSVLEREMGAIATIKQVVILDSSQPSLNILQPSTSTRPPVAVSSPGQSQFQPSRETTLDSSSSEEPDSDCCDMVHETPDPLDVTDPIYTMNITEYVVTFLKSMASNAHFREYLKFLNRGQKLILYKIGIDADA